MMIPSTVGPRLLVIGGILSALASALHLAIIVGGPSWYRFFGAGERTARLAARGGPGPPLMAVAIAAVLAVWAAYAFSGAGLIRRLPLLRTALVLISAVYLLRGMVLFAMLATRPATVTSFWIWSSLIVLAYGAAYALGTWLSWPSLTPHRTG